MNIKTEKFFKINYSYYPYLQISKNLSYRENAMLLYKNTGMLNITKLEYYYLDNYKDIKISDFNQIHVTMAFGKIYSDIALVSIASVLNASNPDSDIDDGFNYIEDAARANYTPAILRLADCYLRGIGIERDPDYAKDLVTKAKNLGNPDAVEFLAKNFTD